MQWKIIAIASALFLHAQAQEKPAHEIESCRGQVELYCQAEKEQKDFREILKCLARNEDKLSTECKQEFQRFAQASRQTAPPGGGPLGALAGLAGLGAQVPSVAWEGRFIPEPDRGSQTPSFAENTLNMSAPIFRKERDTVALTLGGGHLHLNKSVTLSSGLKIPTDFYKAEGGFQYLQRLEEKKTWGLRGSIGYSGDKIQADTQSYNLTANYSFPAAEENRWVLMVMMSNNSPFGTAIPIPGFLYIYRTSTLTGLFGIPIFSIQWTPVNPWSFSLSAFGPSLKAEAAYGPIDKAQFFTGVGWKQQRYLLADRAKEKERLTIEDKNVEIGFRKPILPGVFFETQVGYLFDRSVYIGESLFGKEGGESSLDSNFYGRCSVKAAF